MQCLTAPQHQHGIELERVEMLDDGFRDVAKQCDALIERWPQSNR